MDFETIECCGRVHVVKNGVESECFAIASYGNHRLIYCPALQAQTASLEEALAFISRGMDTWYTAAQAAEVLVEMGVFDEPPSTQAVTGWCRRGLLPGAVKVAKRGSGGAWRIPEAALMKFAERRKE